MSRGWVVVWGVGRTHAVREMLDAVVLVSCEGQNSISRRIVLSSLCRSLAAFDCVCLLPRVCPVFPP
jgi:hypothetical protein